MMKNFGKEYYVQSIRQENKTLTEIAAETGVSINTVKARIKKCYQRKAWAERLIAIALENEKEQKEKQQKQQKMVQAEVVDKKNVVTDKTKTEKKAILIDTSMLLNYPEALSKKDEKLLIPRFCWHTAMKIVEGEKKTNPSLAIKHEEAMSSLDVEEVFIQSLPYIHRVPERVKPHSVMFLKYLVKLRETNPEIRTLTCSREIKEIASLNGITL